MYNFKVGDESVLYFPCTVVQVDPARVEVVVQIHLPDSAMVDDEGTLRARLPIEGLMPPEVCTAMKTMANATDDEKALALGTVIETMREELNEIEGVEKIDLTHGDGDGDAFH